MNTSDKIELLAIGTLVVSHIGHQMDRPCEIIGYEQDQYGRTGYMVRFSNGQERVRSILSVKS